MTISSSWKKPRREITASLASSWTSSIFSRRRQARGWSTGIRRGAILRGIIEDFLKAEHAKKGYETVMIPHLAKIDLWHTSGHSGYYMENMYTTKIDEQEYVVKPMNCPGHILIFKRKVRSYSELPIRYFELGTVYRNEKSGVLHGLLRVRGFTQDDAHIFCRHDQLQDEIIQRARFHIRDDEGVQF